VGFPGETEAEFVETLKLIEEVTFASSFFFKYSGRPGTPAAIMDEQVSEEAKSERLARLQELVDSQRRSFNHAMLGRECDVLFEKPGRHPGQIGGKSPWLQPVHVDGPTSLIGEVAKVRIIDIGSNSLAGELLTSEVSR